MKRKRQPRRWMSIAVAACFGVLVVLALLLVASKSDAPAEPPCVVLDVRMNVQERIDGVMGCLEAQR